MKQYLLFTIIILCSNFFHSCNNGEANQKTTVLLSPQEVAAKACVQRIIAYDEELGTIRNHACEKQSLSKTINEYVAALEAANFENCPSAFQSAFEQHIGAWKAMVTITDKYPDLRGEMHDLLEEIEETTDGKEMKALTKAVFDTWRVVENEMKK